MSRKSRKRRQSRNYTWAVVVAGLGLLLLLALIFWESGKTPEVQSTSEGNYPAVSRVKLSDARAALSAHKATFVDVRDAASYAAGHIPNALLIPLDEVESRLAELDRSAWIITYCT